MDKIVCKFGGTSLADSAQMQKVRDIVHSSKDRMYVVVSAPGKRHKDDTKVTDLLYASLSDEEAFDKVVTRFFSLEKDLNVSHRASDYLIAHKSVIQNDKDFAASRGEFCSALVMSEFLGFEFIDAESIIDIDENGKTLSTTFEKIQKEIKEGVPYVIPGFYGKGVNDKVKTFSRGGSDITGSLIARAVNAKLYENWSDVSGVMSANPRIVENPLIIDELSYEEMELLAEYGAEVYHHDAVECIRDIVPINIRNTNSPNDKGTMIVSSRAHKPLSHLAVTSKDNTVYVLGDLKVLESKTVENKDSVNDVLKQLYAKYFV